MYFDSLGAALAMDGHGAYVWSAYAISLVVVVLILLVPVRRQGRFLRQLAGEQKRQQQGPIAGPEDK
ncbi:MAG: heme exporter protein CcmD [Halioglobus sp.]|nr:heme exporter protein CcmD [Halioglobus sp.]